MQTKRLKQLFQFLENSPGDCFLCFAIAKEYEKAEDWDNALAYYLKIAQNEPDYVGLYYHLGKLYEVLQDPNTAFATYKKGMDIAQKLADRHAYSELATAKLELGDDEDFE